MERRNRWLAKVNRRRAWIRKGVGKIGPGGEERGIPSQRKKWGEYVPDRRTGSLI